MKASCKFAIDLVLFSMISIMKTHPALKILNGALVDLPSPSIITSWWNFGSLLGLCLSTQLIRGLFLAMHYTGNVSMAFERVRRIGTDVNLGWLLRIIHANGARMFFICLFTHTGRGLYYGSFKYQETWSIGVIILLLVMAAAFMGYVLPWGQISFWGATVITSLLMAIPYVGERVVIWLWGGFAVSNPTLTRFFVFHFILPFVVAAIAIIHLLFLHQTGSNNPLGVNPDYDKTPFHPYFSWKDTPGFIILLTTLGAIVLMAPWMLGDPENFIPANPLVTPVHIQPEWYFLFAYAILRSIPNKLGGVAALGLSVLILLIMPYMPNRKFQSISWYPLRKIFFWSLVVCAILLRWVGARPVEEPYVISGQLLGVFYFSYFLTSPYLKLAWDNA